MGINNFTQFSYDGLWRNTKIVETTSGSVTSTKQFVWSEDRRREERDGSSAVTKQFFVRGQRNSSTNYFYNIDHLGSIREMTDSSGLVQAQYLFDPFGRSSKQQGSLESDFQYAAYFMHSRSGNNLTLYRSYSPQFGRWMTRDSVGEIFATNLYAYVANVPTFYVDPFGLSQTSASANSAAYAAGGMTLSWWKIKCACEDYCTTPDVLGSKTFDDCMTKCMNRVLNGGHVEPPYEGPPPGPKAGPPNMA